jgi:hypothetical protein
MSQLNLSSKFAASFVAGTFAIPYFDTISYPPAYWLPVGAVATAPTPLGMGALTAVGTLTARTIATTNALTKRRRLGVVSVATAAGLASLVDTTAANLLIGTSGGLGGGFLLSTYFGISDAATVSGARMFIGLRNSTAAPTNVEPSTLVNSVGIGHGAADTNLKIFTGGSAAQAPIDLGANFPITTNTNAYQLVLYAPQNPVAAGFTIGYFVKRLGTTFTASGTLTGAVGTALPAATALLNYSAFRTNNATALAVGLDVGALISLNLAT